MEVDNGLNDSAERPAQPVCWSGSLDFGWIREGAFLSNISILRGHYRPRTIAFHQYLHHDAVPGLS